MIRVINPPYEQAAPTPNELTEQVTGRRHTSYSEISTYQSCSLRWHYQYVEHAPKEQISAALIMGSGVHAAIQRHLEAVIASEKPPTTEELMLTYQQTWHEETNDIPVQMPKGATAESLAETAAAMLTEFQQSPYAQPTGEIIGIEEAITTKLADDLPDIASRIDLIEFHDGVLTVTDFKTARSMWNPSTADDNSDQLVLYGNAVREMAQDLNAKVELRFVILTKAKSPKVEARPVQMDQDKLTRTTTVVRHVQRAMQAGIVFPSPSQMNCSGCPYQQRCGAWHREM